MRAFGMIFAAPGLKLVEWPQNAEGRLPCPIFDFRSTMADATRRDVAVHAFTPQGVTLTG